MQRLTVLAGRIAAGTVSLLVIGLVLTFFIGVAMDQRPFGISSAFLPQEHPATRLRPDGPPPPIVVSIDTIPAIMLSGWILSMIVVAPEISRMRPPSHRRR